MNRVMSTSKFNNTSTFFFILTLACFLGQIGPVLFFDTRRTRCTSFILKFDGLKFKYDINETFYTVLKVVKIFVH